MHILRYLVKSSELLINSMGRLLITLPFFYFLANNRPTEIVYWGVWGLVLLGSISILFEINLNLGIIYVLIGLGIYCYQNSFNIYYLWVIGGLLCLVKFPEIKIKERVVVVERPVIEEARLVEEVRPVLDEWARYEGRQRRPILNKIKEKFRFG